MLDHQGDAAGQAALGERVVDDAARSAARGDEGVREGGEGREVEALADLRVAAAGQAHVALAEQPARADDSDIPAR